MLAIAVAAAGGLFSPYYVFVMTSVVITALLCLSVGVTTERAGMISLCQVGMAGVGAWVANWLLVSHPEVGVGAALLAGCAVPAVLALVIALPTLRVRGVQLAIVTLAFALAVNIWLTRQGFTGADAGDSYMREGWLEDDAHLLLLCAVVAIVVSRLLVALEQRPFGAAWFGVKFSERAVAALGVNAPWAKISAFAVGAAVAGLAGGMLVLQLGTLSSRNFEPMASLLIFVLAVLARSRFLSGALIAALLTWFVPELLSRAGLAEWKDMGDLLFALGALHALRIRFKSGVAAAASQRDAADTGRPPAGLAGKWHDGVSLHLDRVSVRYGATLALSDVTLDIRPGIVTGLVGPNGAGKSTLVDALSGFTRASGEILLDGHSLQGLSAHERARLGLRRTFQVGRVIPELTVGQYLHLASGESPARVETAQMLAWLCCPPLETPVASLDVGTRRLVELSGALLSRPRILLLDEPAAGMSTRESAHLARVIRQVPEVLGCTVLLIEHDLALIREVCTDLIVLEFGRVIAAGPVEETLAQRHVVDAYIGAAV
ncbi:MAG: ATP-binding cassette domain-containing protein [Pigmentiphaga sp.]